MKRTHLLPLFSLLMFSHLAAAETPAAFGTPAVTGTAGAAMIPGGESGGGGDVFVKEYNQVRKYWINRLEWVVKHRAVFESAMKGGCGYDVNPDDHAYTYIYGDIDPFYCYGAAKLLALLNLPADQFKVSSSPAYIDVMVNGKKEQYPAYSTKLDDGRYSTAFNFQYWAALNSEQRKELVLHEQHVVLGAETTNEMDLTDRIIKELKADVDAIVLGQESENHYYADQKNVDSDTTTAFEVEELVDDMIVSDIVWVTCEAKPKPALPPYFVNEPFCETPGHQNCQQVQLQQVQQQQQGQRQPTTAFIKLGEDMKTKSTTFHCSSWEKLF